MRDVRLSVVRDVGHVKLTPETHDDMYTLFGMVHVGDRIRASTVRKVLTESSSGGASSSERVRTKLTLKVVEVLFDPDLGELRVSGTNVEENDLVRVGAFHTLELELDRPFELHKDAWTDEEVSVLRAANAAAGSEGADIFAVMLDTGTAQVCAVTSAMTIVRARLDVPVPSKRAGTDRHEAARARFFDAVLSAMRQKIDFSAARVIVIASPGFLKDEFLDFVLAAAAARGLKEVADARDRFVCVHSTGGHKHALAATLANPAAAARILHTRAASEGEQMGRFCRMLAEDAERAQYGWRHVRAAVSADAVERLLVSDALLRAQEPSVRRDVQRLIKDAQAGGADVSTLSSMHVSGQELQGLGGVAAILRFSVYGIDDAARAVAPLGTADVEVVPDATGGTALPGHRVQAPAPVVKVRPFMDTANGGFDTDSDKSDDSDEYT